MPLYDFKCQNADCGAINEIALTMAERENPGTCRTCFGNLQRIFLSRQEAAQRFDPVVVHYNPTTKQYSFPGHANAPVRAGYERQEIRTLAEVNAFERQRNQAERGRAERVTEDRLRRIEHSEKSRRSEIYAKLGNNISNFGREVMRLSAEQRNARRPKTQDPGFHIDAFHYDKSNRETDGRGRRGQ